MERLYPKTIELTKNLIRQMKNIDGASVSLEVGEELINTIEAQQQELNKVGRWPVTVGDSFFGQKIVGADFTDKIITIKWDKDGENVEELKELLTLKQQIEAQQQEIEQLKEKLKLQEAITMREMAKVEALTADKDEQAGQIMRMEGLLKQAKYLMRNTERYLRSVMDVAHELKCRKKVETYNGSFAYKCRYTWNVGNLQTEGVIRRRNKR